MSFKRHLYSKERSPIFILFGSWSVVIISMFELSQSFFGNSNLVILVYIRRLHEHSKLI